MILIVGSNLDRTIIHTVKTANRLNIPFCFFDLYKFAVLGNYFWDYRSHTGHFGYKDIEYKFPNSEITGIYSRIINVFYNTTGRKNRLLGSRVQALAEILSDLRGMNVVNRDTDFSNSSKLYQLYILSQCGFLVPNSLLTNNPYMTRSFIKGKDVVYKAASSEKTITSIYTKAQSSRLSLLKNSPVLFQERIKGFDVRTHLIGSEFYSEKIETDVVDYRFDSGQKEFSALDIPKSIEKKCLEYQKLSGVDFIGFDFKVKDTGEYFVLEANLMPGYDTYDKRLKYRISRALLKFLGKLELTNSHNRHIKFGFDENAIQN